MTDDPWSLSIAAFLAAACKVPADLHVAQAYDPNQVIDAAVLVYKVDGVAATALRDALIAAWKGDFPEMTVSEVTVGGKDVTKGEFGEDTITSYLYVSGDVVYDIESADEAIATAALAALPEGGAAPIRPRPASPPHRASLRRGRPRRSRQRADASNSVLAAAPDGGHARGGRARA